MEEHSCKWRLKGFGPKVPDLITLILGDHKTKKFKNKIKIILQL